MGAGPMDSTQIFVPKWFANDNNSTNNTNTLHKQIVNDHSNQSRVSPENNETRTVQTNDLQVSNAWSHRSQVRTTNTNSSYPPLRSEQDSEKYRTPVPLPPGLSSSKGFPKASKAPQQRTKPATFQHPEPPKTIPIRKSTKEEEKKATPSSVSSFVALERKIKPVKKDQPIQEEKPEVKKEEEKPCSLPIPIESPTKHEKVISMSSSIEREESFMRRLGWTECDEDSDIEITQEEKEAIYKKKELFSKKLNHLSNLKSPIVEEPSDDGSDSDSEFCEN